MEVEMNRAVQQNEIRLKKQDIDRQQEKLWQLEENLKGSERALTGSQVLRNTLYSMSKMSKQY